MEAAERDAQEGQSRGDTKGAGAGHEWGKETDGTETGTGRTGLGRAGRRGAAQAGRDRTEPGAERHREAEEGGEGAWERQRDGENQREKWGREREVERRDGGRGGGVRDTHMEGRPGKETNRKQSQRQVETA